MIMRPFKEIVRLPDFERERGLTFKAQKFSKDGNSLAGPLKGKVSIPEFE
jgi:hypothetical protein